VHDPRQSPRPKSPSNGVVALLAIGGVFSNLVIFLILITIVAAITGTDTTTATSAPTTTTAPPSSAPATTTTTTAPPPEYIVAEVLTGDSVVLNDGKQTITVTIAGIDAPDVTTAQCWAAEAKKFAADTLIGQKIVLPVGTVAAHAAVRMILADGRDFAVLAIATGAVRAAADTADTAVKEAEAAARLAALGLWGQPCFGELVAAPPVQPLVPAPPAEEPPVAEPAPAAYYKNCDAVRAAGKAPLYRGEPGYRSGLDRDGDGTACE